MLRISSVVASSVLAAALVTALGVPGRPASTNAVADPGFESGGFATWEQCGTRGLDARVTTALVHHGKYALRAGSTSHTSGEIDGDEGLCQQVKVPRNGVLRFWVDAQSNETSTEYSYQEAEFLNSHGDTLEILWQASATTGGWAQKTVDVSKYAGQTVSLYFGVHGNGFAKVYTTLYVDDVELKSGGTITPTPAPPTPGELTTPSSVTPTPAPAMTPTPSGTAPGTAAPGGAMIPAPAAGSIGATCGTHCGSERWHVKTMTDPQATQVNRTIKVTTIETLIAATAPVPASGKLAAADNIRFAPWELQAVQIRGTIVGWKAEADNDYHIAIASLKDPTKVMIIEPPSSACSGACSSGYGAMFQAARAEIERCMGGVASTTSFGAPKNPKPLVADVTGIPYFDPLHGQKPVAPNGIEIHPVISVSFVSGC